MIPFAIQGFIVPIGAGIGTFWKRLLDSHQARSLVSLCMIIGKPYYIIINSEVNEFVFGRSFFFDMIDSGINGLIGFSDVRAS